MLHIATQCRLCVAFYVCCILCNTGLAMLLLSDLPTPSFVIDMRALRQKMCQQPKMDEKALPSLHLPKLDCTLYPIPKETQKLDRNASVLEMTFDDTDKQQSIGFLHTSVVRAKEDAVSGQDDPFLAELDLSPELCGGNNGKEQTSLAKLVLGLNNHHVGSYYWARSAGTGASMDAPGVSYDVVQNGDTERGILRWETTGGPTECNTNDGKRSEWVNFLRKGDTVQLIPEDGQDAIASFLEFAFDNDNESSSRIFGVSTDGRPLGSEPMVLCEWRNE